MATTKRLQQAISLLLPVGVLGASTVLASAQAHARAAPDTGAAGGDTPAATGVAERLRAIRESAAVADENATLDVSAGDRILLAEWINFGGGGLGWRNGGWGNGGWRNGGWGNGGWHNWGNGGWGNGGWHNWNNGWHNWGNGGWHNFWHNW